MRGALGDICGTFDRHVFDRLCADVDAGQWRCSENGEDADAIAKSRGWQLSDIGDRR